MNLTVFFKRCSIEDKKTWSGFLTENQKAKIDKLKRLDQQVASTTVHGALNQYLGKFLGLTPEEIPYAYTKYGKPYLKMNKSCHFNISHSENYTAFGVSSQNIGVDIETEKKDSSILEISKFLCHEDEQSEFDTLNEAELKKQLYRTWVIKESVLKANGIGIQYSMTEMLLTPNKTDPSQGSCNLSGSSYHFKYLEIEPNVHLSVASEHEAGLNNLSYVNLKESISSV